MLRCLRRWRRRRAERRGRRQACPLLCLAVLLPVPKLGKKPLLLLEFFRGHTVDVEHIR